MYLTYVIIPLLLLLSSCTPSSFEDFRSDGEGISRQLIATLKPIHTRQELLAIRPKLKTLFDKLVDTMIAAHEFRQKYPYDENAPLSMQERVLSDELKQELSRIYASVEGGREIIEQCQEEALDRLNAFLNAKR